MKTADFIENIKKLGYQPRLLLLPREHIKVYDEANGYIPSKSNYLFSVDTETSRISFGKAYFHSPAREKLFDTLIAYYKTPITQRGFITSHPQIKDFEIDPASFVDIKWQDGTILEAGVNGAQVNDAIGVILAQIKVYQEKFPCKENAMTITKLEEAILWQDARTKDRVARGVEGVHTV